MLLCGTAQVPLKVHKQILTSYNLSLKTSSERNCFKNSLLNFLHLLSSKMLKCYFSGSCCGLLLLVVFFGGVVFFPKI